MKTINIYLDTTGKIKGLYNDLLVEMNLGTISVQRASNVEFNNSTQKWEVDIIGKGIIALFDTRQEALDWEIKYLENRIENDKNIP